MFDYMAMKPHVDRLKERADEAFIDNAIEQIINAGFHVGITSLNSLLLQHCCGDGSGANRDDPEECYEIILKEFEEEYAQNAALYSKIFLQSDDTFSLDDALAQIPESIRPSFKEMADNLMIAYPKLMRLTALSCISIHFKDEDKCIRCREEIKEVKKYMKEAWNKFREVVANYNPLEDASRDKSEDSLISMLFGFDKIKDKKKEEKE